MTWKHVATTALALVVMLVVQGVSAGFLLADLKAPADGNATALVLLSDLMTVVLLVVLAARMAPCGRLRWSALLFIYWGLLATGLTEAAFFSLDMGRGLLLRLTVQQFTVALAVALLVDRMLPAAAGVAPAAPRAAAAWLTRLALTVAAYIAAYFTAGRAVWPYVADFYGGKTPAVGAVVAMQVLRGLLLSGIVVLITERTRDSRWTQAALAGVTLSVLGGVAPLLVPNPFMPKAVRHAHMVEVGVSNLAWGVLAGFVLSRRGAPPRTPGTSLASNPLG